MPKTKIIQNKFMLFMGAGGIVVFALIAFVLLSATATTKAVVFIEDTAAGTTITENIVQEIDIPRATPGNFYKTVSSVLGEKTTVAIKANQLIYESDIMSKIDLSSTENDNFVTTSIKVPNDNALGGMLSAGDVVDISVVPDSGESTNLAETLKDFGITASLDGGIYYILSNVPIISCTTSVSNTDEENSVESVTSAEEKNSAYYIVSLSYNDYKKLRLAEQYGTLWLNLAPNQNKDNDPLITEMQEEVKGGLSDAKKETTETSTQPTQDTKQQER